MRLVLGEDPSPTELMPVLSLAPPGMPEDMKSSPWGNTLCSVPTTLSSTPGLGLLAYLPGTPSVIQGAPHISNGVQGHRVSSPPASF